MAKLFASGVLFAFFYVLHGVSAKTVYGSFKSKEAQKYHGQYITTFCFQGQGFVTYDMDVQTSGKLYFFTEENWFEASSTAFCQQKLSMAKFSYELVNLKGDYNITQWMDARVWHIIFADSYTCDVKVPLSPDVNYKLELFNLDVSGKPTEHFGCDETGLISFYKFMVFLYFGAAVVYGQRLWQTINKGGPMNMGIRMLSTTLALDALSTTSTLLHLLWYSIDGRGAPFMFSLSLVFDCVAEFQMLHMMAMMSLGWSVGANYSTDPESMKQIKIVLIFVSILEIALGSHVLDVRLLLALVKIVIAGAAALNINKKITSERSALRRDFYSKFLKGCLTWTLSFPGLAFFCWFCPYYYRYKILIWGSHTARTVAILLLYKLFLSRSLYWEVSSLSSSLPLRLEKGFGLKKYTS